MCDISEHKPVIGSVPTLFHKLLHTSVLNIAFQHVPTSNINFLMHYVVTCHFILVFQERILDDLNMEMETTSNRLDFVQVYSQLQPVFCLIFFVALLYFGWKTFTLNQTEVNLGVKRKGKFLIDFLFCPCNFLHCMAFESSTYCYFCSWYLPLCRKKWLWSWRKLVQRDSWWW